jgi:hypothetical protein
VNQLKTLWAKEPTVILWVLTGIIVFVAAKFGIVVDKASLVEALAYLVPFVIGAVVNRSQVAPVASLPKPTT